MRDFTAAERDEMRRLVANLPENIGQPTPERPLTAQPVAIVPEEEKAQKGKVPQVGLFFLVEGRLFADGRAWTEVTSEAGTRIHGVSHPEYWQRLQKAGAVPSDLEYDKAPRGRVNYEDASGKFTLSADRCIIMDNGLASAIMNELNLPMGTRGLVDEQYRCPTCASKGAK